MDASAISWLSEMGLDNPIFTDKCDFMDSFDEELAAALEQDFETCFSPGNNSPPAKLQKCSNFSSFSTIQGLSNPIILNFENAKSPENNNPEEQFDEKSKSVKKTGRVRPRSQTYDHIIAERKRREQLSQRFVALSTIVPGLKKMDKTSVLGDTIKYLKHLQERVKTLEEQTTKQTMESIILVNKSQINDTSDQQPLPEIEARLCNKTILLRVHCENQRGVLVNLLSQVENLNLTVVNSNVTTFGKFALHITIITEMEKEFNLTATELVKRLREALQGKNV